MLGDKGIARENYPILNSQNEEIGYVSTGYKLDGYDRSIGLGFVPKPFGKLGTEINIGIRKKIIPATVIQRKFYNKKYKK
jgi:aminomethyltransferase